MNAGVVRSELGQVSSFWRRVPGHPGQLSAPNVNATCLEDAARIAFDSRDIAFAPRRPRELIDLRGRFRCFRFGDREWFAKRSKLDVARVEEANAREAASRLNRTKTPLGVLLVVVPTIVTLGDDGVLITEDIGATLHDRVVGRGGAPDPCEVLQVLNIILQLGVVWEGFAPRNLVRRHSPDSLLMLDWECARFSVGSTQQQISDLEQTKWVLNWWQLYDEGDARTITLKRGIEQMTAYPEEAALDAFEMTYRSLARSWASMGQVRLRCSELTLHAERPMSGLEPGLMPMELGHVIDDLMVREISVLFTAWVVRIRRRDDPEAVRAMFRLLDAALRLGLAEGGACTSSVPGTGKARRYILDVMLAYEDGFRPSSHSLEGIRRGSSFEDVLASRSSVVRAVQRIGDYGERHGLHAASRRSEAADLILNGLTSLASEAFEDWQGLDVLVRGSLGQCLPSSRSDVDFEISGEERPDGFLSMERLFSQLLEILGISSEGSSGRPTEADLFSSVGTRDLHEWMELRKPGNTQHDPGWLTPHYVNGAQGAWWRGPSHFERTGRPLTAKRLFFEVRTLIARCAFACEFKEAATLTQLECLAVRIGTVQTMLLYNLLGDALALYESDGQDRGDLDRVQGRINEAYARLESGGGGLTLGFPDTSDRRNKS